MLKLIMQSIYKHFEIKPVAILSDCSFDNLYRCGVDYGTDVCKYEESTDVTTCKECELYKVEKEYWPEIDNEMLLRFYILLDMNMCDLYESIHYDYPVDKIQDVVFHNLLRITPQDKLYRQVQTLLNNYLSEFKSL